MCHALSSLQCVTSLTGLKYAIDFNFRYCFGFGPNCCVICRKLFLATENVIFMYLPYSIKKPKFFYSLNNMKLN